MSEPALSRLLAVAKSIKHATILATEIFQAGRDAALASLNSYWRIPAMSCAISAKTLFGNKNKEVAKGNYEAQQQRFLASSSTATNLQQQKKVAYSAPPA